MAEQTCSTCCHYLPETDQDFKGQGWCHDPSKAIQRGGNNTRSPPYVSDDSTCLAWTLRPAARAPDSQGDGGSRGQA